MKGRLLTQGIVYALCAVGLIVCVVVGVTCGREEVDCNYWKAEADTLATAATACSSELVGCNLTNADIVAVIKAQKKAQACEARESSSASWQFLKG